MPSITNFVLSLDTTSSPPRTIGATHCHQPPSSSSISSPYPRASRHSGSAIEDIRRSICGRGPNGPARCRASRRVRVCVIARIALLSAYPGIHIADTPSNSYEGLPPNFSLLQNMTAGAFAGIAVSLLPSSVREDRRLIFYRSILSCTRLMLSRCALFTPRYQ